MSDKIRKSANIRGLILDDWEMVEINKYTLKALTADEVFAFKVRMCGNEIDRDYEAFTLNCLYKLAELYEGKPVIRDHSSIAENQTARIYRTKVIKGDAQTKTGEAYSQLVAYCYMPRTAKNQDLITEIEAGIKKEVSVGCAVQSAICSICGKDNSKIHCEHMPGKSYGDQVCYFKLENPVDAYELSFVAVPAQKDAGVIKSYSGEKPQKTEQRIKSNAEKLISAFFKSFK